MPSYLEKLLGNLCEVAPFDVVVGLQEDFAQTRLAEGVVLQIEAIEPLECVAIGLPKFSPSPSRGIVREHREYLQRDRRGEG